MNGIIDYKILGNQCFGAAHYLEAITFYTKGLRVCKKAESTDFYLNRAACYIKLGCFQKGLQDTGTVLADNPEHEKGIFRHIQCLWGLGKYEEALETINKKLSGQLHTEDLQELRRKAEAFLHQSQTGTYDVIQLMKHQEKEPLQPASVAEYCGPIKIRDVAGKGRGLVAQDSIKSGELVLCCKPFVFHAHDDHDNLEDKSNSILFERIIEKLKAEPELAKEIFSLHQIPREEDQDFQDQDDSTNSNESLEQTLRSIVSANAFEYNGCGAELSGRVGGDIRYYWKGIWILPSYINHSCSEANCIWTVFGDAFFVRAVKPIKEGDEILISYVNISWPYHDRQRVIQGHGFVCGCRLCELERSEDTKVLQKREKLFEKLSELRSMEDNIPKEAVILTFKELEWLRKETPELNFSLVYMADVVRRFLVEREDPESRSTCCKMLKKIHSISKNTAHAKYVPSVSLNILEVLFHEEALELTEIQNWITQLRDDLRVAHGSPKALQITNPEVFHLLKEMFLANEFE